MSPASTPSTCDTVTLMAQLCESQLGQSYDPFWIFNPSNRVLLDFHISLLNLLSSTYASSPALSFLPFFLLNLIDYLSQTDCDNFLHIQRLHLAWNLSASLEKSLIPASILIPMALSSETGADSGKVVVLAADASPPKFTLRKTGLPLNRSFLLARVVGAKKVIGRFFFQEMKAVWRPEGIYEQSQLEDNLFLFSFADPDDIQRIVDGSPWDYDSNSKWVVIKPVSSSDQFSSVPLSELCISVRVHDLPFEFRDQYNLSGIANSVGMRVVSMDDPNACRNFVQFRCWIDVEKPLVDKVELPREDGELLSLPFTYVNLPTFCYYCGVLGHGFKHCAKWNQAASVDAVALPFSDSLRATEDGHRSSATRNSPSRFAGGRRTPARTPSRKSAPVTGGQSSLIGSNGPEVQLHTGVQRSSGVINEPLLDKVLFQVKELLIGKKSRDINSPLKPKMLQMLDSVPPPSMNNNADDLDASLPSGLGLHHDPQAKILIPGIGLLGAGPKTSSAGPSGSAFEKPILLSNPKQISSSTPIPYTANHNSLYSPERRHPRSSPSTTAGRRLLTPPPVVPRSSIPTTDTDLADLSSSELKVDNSSPTATLFYSPIRSVRGLSSPGLSWSPTFDESDSATVLDSAGNASPPASRAAAPLLQASFSLSPMSGTNEVAVSPKGSPTITLFPFSNSSMNKGCFEFTAVNPKEKGHLTFDSDYIAAVKSGLRFDVSPSNPKRSGVVITELEGPAKKRKNNDAGPVLLERYSRNRVKTKSKAYNRRQAQILATAGRTPLHLPASVSSVGEDSPFEDNSSPRPEAEAAQQPCLDQ